MTVSTQSVSTQSVSTLSKAAKLAAATAALTALIPPAPNAHDAKAPVKTETFIEQGVVDSWLRAETNASEAAVHVFRACLMHRVSPGQLVGRADAKVRASEYNQAFELAKRIGAKPAAKIIDNAAKAPGCKRSNVLAAIRSHKKVGDALKGSALRGAALQKEIAKRADDAVKVTSAKRADKQKAEAAKRATRLPAMPKAGTLDAYIPQLMAALMDAQKQLAKLSIPARKQGLVSDLSKALEEAIDISETINDK